MKTTWVFFKLRMKQLKYDKVALFFCYVFPVILLLGIGYPLEIAGGHKVKVSYLQGEMQATSLARLDALARNPLVHLAAFPGSREEAEVALKNDEIQHLLGFADGAGVLTVRSNSLEENRVGAVALSSLLREGGGAASDVRLESVEVSRRSSYLATLLPGVIAMTLLIIGLSGFGSVLIEEESQGLYRNLKTIDVSPVPFFSGLFLSRMLVAQTVAIGMFAVSVFGLGVPADINYLLLLLVVTLGAATFLGIGLLVFLCSRTVMAFNGVVSVIQVPLILLGGVFFSIATFPAWLQPLAEFSPLAPFTSALRELMFGDVGFHNIATLYPSLAVLTAWMVVTLLVARWKFRW